MAYLAIIYYQRMNVAIASIPRVIAQPIRPTKPTVVYDL